MICFYCKRCGKDNDRDVCSVCGRRITAAGQIDKWSVDTIPLADGRAWRGALLALSGAAGLVLCTVFGLEALLGGPARVRLLWQSSLIRLTLSLAAVGLAASALLLALQGREINVFTLDHQGAHQVTWHGPQKWKSWARLQSADPEKNFIQTDGTLVHMSQERHMLWQDVIGVQYQPRRSTILLYHTPRVAPMALRLPANEYELAENWVRKYCKKAGRQ